MFGEIFSEIFQWRWTIGAVIFGGMCFYILAAVLTKKFSFQSRGLAVYAFFTAMNTWTVLWLVAAFLWTAAVCSFALTAQEPGFGFFLFLFLCLIEKLVVSAKIGSFIKDLFQSLLITSALFLECLLVSYLRQTRFYGQMTIITVFLVLFIVLYSLTWFLREVSTILKER